VAAAIGGFSARVSIEGATGVHISSPTEEPIDFRSPLSVANEGEVGPGSSHRLAIAVIRLFFTTALERGWVGDLGDPGQGFAIRYASDIPRQVGLAGSSAIAVALLRALAAHHGRTIPLSELPGLALRAETDGLGIHGGLMDRVSQAYGGLLYMDLSPERLDSTGSGAYESLPWQRLPRLYVAWHPRWSAGSDTVHNDLKVRVAAGEAEALALLAELAALADEAREAIRHGDRLDLLPIMDRNFDLRERLVDVGEGNRRLVRTGRRLGAGVKQAGSGGAVIGAHDGDPDRLDALRLAYGRIGARFFVPNVWTAPTAGSTGDEASWGPDCPDGGKTPDTDAS
jgi:glucuronokinase